MFDARSPEGMLRLGYAAVPIAAGLDKFTGLLVDWDKYLSPAARRLLPMRGRSFMRLVGLVEIGAGVLVLTRPRLGAYVVSGWLAAICANLLASGDYFDIAARDALLSLGALALAKLEQPAGVRRALPAAPERAVLERTSAPLRANPSAVDSFTHAQ